MMRVSHVFTLIKSQKFFNRDGLSPLNFNPSSIKPKFMHIHVNKICIIVKIMFVVFNFI